MKWVTRERVKVDRVACPWLIKKFVDPDAEFLFVPVDQVLPVAEREGAIPYDVPDVELGHHEGKCSFEAIVAKYGITDPAVHLLAQIVHGADVAQDLYRRPEAPGLKAIAEGFRHLGLSDDHEVLAKEFVVYDALYAYCQLEANSR
ncbi:MAG: chromate resistance protein [Gemmataceae bacterium]|nr:chromate resistance protein [Gemmataceae bacterium]